MDEIIQDAFLVACIVLASLALCIIAIVLKKMGKIKGARDHENSSASSESSNQSASTEASESNGSKCASLGSVLMSSLRCCEAKKWEERNLWSWKANPSPLLGRKGGDVGWQSHSSDSPVWQRPILMGEKCEFPRFSGVILYDENGHPLREFHRETSYSEADHQENSSSLVRTTLRDLL